MVCQKNNNNNNNKLLGQEDILEIYTYDMYINRNLLRFVFPFLPEAPPPPQRYASSTFPANPANALGNRENMGSQIN